jgi:hypothetical protein
MPVQKAYGPSLQGPKDLQILRITDPLAAKGRKVIRGKLCSIEILGAKLLACGPNVHFKVQGQKAAQDLDVCLRIHVPLLENE